MADLLILPLAVTLDGVHRLHDELEAAVRDRAELGSRKSQIACLTASLACSIEQLRAALPAAVREAGLDEELATTFVETAASISNIAQLVSSFADACVRASRS